VLAADTIHVHHRQPCFTGTRTDLLPPQGLLPRVIRRAVDDRDHIGAAGARLLRRLGKPAVLADDESEAQRIYLDHARFLAGGEIALLVEYRIVGQAVLAIDALDAAIAQY